MKSLPQHACDECNELLKQLAELQRRMSEAKRQPDLQAMQIELSALQLDFGSVIDKAREMKTFVTRAFAVEMKHEYPDEIPARRVPMFPAELETMQQAGVPAHPSFTDHEY